MTATVRVSSSAAAREAGMVPLRESAVRLVLAGDTTVDEVLRSIYTVDEYTGFPEGMEDLFEEADPVPAPWDEEQEAL